MLGYYAHHHGSGHSNYAQIFAKAFNNEAVVFTSAPFRFDQNIKIERLASEDPDETGTDQKYITLPDYLHYSPVGQTSIQQRSAQLLNRIISEEIKLLIVDVSVEIAAFSRATSVPYAYVRLVGDRNDPGHLQAFQGAVFLLAYFPEEFESSNTPQWVREKTIYLGFFNRFSENPGKKTSTNSDSDFKNIVVLSGKGGNDRLMNYLPSLQKRFSYSRIYVYGAQNLPQEKSENLIFKKSTPRIWETLQEADLIVANCGLNLTSEIIEVQKPFLSIPEARPYKEQEFMHKSLLENKLAVDIDFIENNDDPAIKKQMGSNSKYLRKFAPLIFKNWLEANLYDPRRLRNSIAEIQTQLNQYEAKPNYHI